jgi:hypothetical protein
MNRQAILIAACCAFFNVTAQAQTPPPKVLRARIAADIGQSTYQLDIEDRFDKAPPEKPQSEAATKHHPERYPGYQFNRILSIRCIENCRQPVAYREDVMLDGLIGIFQPGDTSRDIVTTWVGATCYWVRIYRIGEHGIAKVMEAASKSLPQFVTGKDGAPLIVTNNPDAEAKPESRQVHGIFWKWNGKAYNYGDIILN